MTFIRRAPLLVLAAMFTLGAANPRPAHDWVATRAATPEGGHRMGDPAAPVKLIAFVSYTCSHCAHFEKEADAPLQLAYVATGKVSYEVRNFLRDPVDLTAAVLANCGPQAKFFGNNAALFRSQDQWIAIAERAGTAQRERWSTGSYAQRRRYIAADLGFIPIMIRRGYTRPQIDKCLADDALATRLAEQTERDATAFGIEGTPSFAINGALLAGTHSWGALEPQLKARF